MNDDLEDIAYKKLQKILLNCTVAAVDADLRPGHEL